MSLPVVSVAGNGFLSSGHRFRIKGVAYVEKGSGSTPIDVLADSRASQCAIDGPLIKALGANTINVYYTDATQSHDKCMQIFQDNGIYIIANMANQWDRTLLNMTGLDVNSNIANSTWQMDVFKDYAAVLDSMAGYSNLLGLLIGDEIVTGQYIENKGSTVDLAPYLKAAARDMKAYTASRQYRPIPIGYATSAEYTYMQALGEYLVCGGNSDETIDFYSVNGYQWCGNSSVSASGYDELTSKLEGLAVPIFFSEDGCNKPDPRLFGDQSAIFESNLSSIWSGAIVYEWRQESSNYGLVSYTTSGASTPATLADYNALKSQWSAVTANTQPPSTFSTPSCPTSINSSWTINPSAALPTIAGLDFANIKAAYATGTSTSTSARPSSSMRSKQSTGTMAGISVGIVLGVVLVVIGIFLYFCLRRRKRNRQKKSSSSTAETSETHATGSASHIAPSIELAHTDSPNELPGSDPRAQEIDSVVAHKAGRGEV